MKKTVLRFGLASAAIVVAISSIMLSLCMSGRLDFDNMELVGYSTMVLAFLMVFAGIRSYRDNVGAGAISFGQAFKVGILITLVTCAIYVLAWEITYYGFWPDFLDQYSAYRLERMHADGASEAAVQTEAAKMADLAKLYKNPLINIGITFMEIFPVGLIVTLVSAAILRRKPSQEAPAAAVTA